MKQLKAVPVGAETDGLNLSNQWNHYMVRPVFKEPINDNAHFFNDANAKSVRLPNWQSSIFRLPNAVLSDVASTLAVLQIAIGGKTLRIYPPFPLSESDETAGGFKNGWIPFGAKSIEGYLHPPRTAISGAYTTPQTDAVSWKICRGLRIDAEQGVETIQLFDNVVNAIALYTKQWWLRSRFDPFRGPTVYGSEVNQQYFPICDSILDDDGNPASAWFAASSIQVPFGFEQPITPTLWNDIGTALASGITHESGLFAFFDACSAYREGEAETFVLSLVLALEILGNKRRQLLGKRAVDFQKMLRETDLCSDSDRKVISLLYVDRGNVAHGRPLYAIEANKEMSIPRYFVIGFRFMRNFLALMKPGDWSAIATMPVARTKRTAKPSSP